jgi:hypothetical protein
MEKLIQLPLIETQAREHGCSQRKSKPTSKPTSRPKKTLTTMPPLPPELDYINRWLLPPLPDFPPELELVLDYNGAELVTRPATVKRERAAQQRKRLPPMPKLPPELLNTLVDLMDMFTAREGSREGSRAGTAG